MPSMRKFCLEAKIHRSNLRSYLNYNRLGLYELVEAGKTSYNYNIDCMFKSEHLKNNMSYFADIINEYYASDDCCVAMSTSLRGQ